MVLWRLRYKLSLRDRAAMFLVRGFEFTHEAGRDWEARYAPLMTQQLRSQRRGLAGKSWYADETDLKVAGKWHYLYRAIARDGNLVDTLLSQTRVWPQPSIPVSLPRSRRGWEWAGPASFSASSATRAR